MGTSPATRIETHSLQLPSQSNEEPIETEKEPSPSQSDEESGGDAGAELKTRIKYVDKSSALAYLLKFVETQSRLVSLAPLVPRFARLSARPHEPRQRFDGRLCKGHWRRPGYHQLRQPAHVHGNRCPGDSMQHGPSTREWPCFCPRATKW